MNQPRREQFGPLTALVRDVAEGAPAQGVLVVLHGRGADEADLFGLLDVFDPQARFVGVALRAPLELPPGGFHWYVVQRVGFPDEPSFAVGAGALAEALTAISAATGIPGERFVLGGFSQGAVMSLAAAIGRGPLPRPAGVIAMSGFLPVVEGFDSDPARASGLPVALSHGLYDEVIPVNFGTETRDQLTELGADVEWRPTPMPHAVDPDLVPHVREWLERVTSSFPSPS